MRKFLVMAAALLLAGGIVLALLVWTNQNRFDRERRDRSAKSLKLTSAIAADTGKRLTPLFKPTGLCQQPCPEILRPSDVIQWSLHTGTGSLIAILHPNPHGKGGYLLYVYAVSPRDDGTLGDQMLTQTLSSLLREFGFPDADVPYREYSEKRGGEEPKAYKSVGPRKFSGMWPVVPRRDQMRTQWQWWVVAEPPAQKAAAE